MLSLPKEVVMELASDIHICWLVNLSYTSKYLHDILNDREFLRKLADIYDIPTPGSIDKANKYKYMIKKDLFFEAIIINDFRYVKAKVYDGTYAKFLSKGLLEAIKHRRVHMAQLFFNIDVSITDNHIKHVLLFKEKTILYMLLDYMYVYMETLTEAIHNQDINAVKLILNKYQKINSEEYLSNINKDKDTIAFHILNREYYQALLKAIKLNNSEMIKFLSNFVNTDREILEGAIKDDDVLLIKLLKFSPNCVLKTALINNKRNISSYIIESFSVLPLLKEIYKFGNAKEIYTSVDMEKLENSAVIAAKRGYFNLVRFLVSRGCRNYDDILSNLILNAYKNSKDTTMIRFLLSKGAEPNIGLVSASYVGNLDLVKLMLKKGATNYEEVLSWPSLDKKIYEYILDWGYTH